MVSGGTLGTSWGVGRYLPYVLVCREIPKVRPGMSRGTLGTSWVVGQEVLSVRPGVSGDTLGTSWGVGRSPDTPGRTASTYLPGLGTQRTPDASHCQCQLPGKLPS
jgi:hypothetical protein